MTTTAVAIAIAWYVASMGLVLSLRLIQPKASS